ncbi:hypothetical protein G9A89_000916 [Geosiphon pyriformis]|nr:hypothetical protein G9A89_000916 [Geosiphon pyriformis]
MFQSKPIFFNNLVKTIGHDSPRSSTDSLVSDDLVLKIGRDSDSLIKKGRTNSDYKNDIDGVLANTNASSSSINTTNKARHHIPSSLMNIVGFDASISIPERNRSPKSLSRREYVELKTKEDVEANDGEKDDWVYRRSSSDDDHSKKKQSQKELLMTHDIDEDSEDSETERSLTLEAIPPLLVAVAWSVLAGSLLDIVKDWDSFVQVKELFILVPVLLNLKGNLEMNLASRMSTSANLGELDKPSVRNSLVFGNLSLLQVQALIVGAVAGIFSFVEGIVFHPHVNSYFESMMVVVASMLCSAMSSMIMGTFMCGLVILCRRYRINPDNIACPMASSLGDLITLVILSLCGQILLKLMHTFISTILFIIMALFIPYWVRHVRKNPYVRDLLLIGWSPLFLAMIISSMAGLVLEQYIEKYSGLALLTPVLTALSGNLGSIYASRISTRLHSNGLEENYRKSEITLFLIHLPIEILFLLLVWWFDMGHVHLTWSFCILYLFVSVICVGCSLVLAKKLTLWLWQHGYDPDNYCLPYLTAILDVIGTALLVLSYVALTNGKS